MSDELYSRSLALIGEEALMRIRRTSAVVVGLGGVGGSAAAVLARSGVGKLTLIDGDCVAESNLNRQYVARLSNIGEKKAFAMGQEVESISPFADVSVIDRFITEENVAELIPKDADYVIDAIDRMRDKVALIRYCHACGIPVISATGAGNRLRAEQLCYADVFRTAGDPVCRILRRELKQDIKHHLVVYSKELPRQVEGSTVASMAFVPNAMGILLGQAVVLSAAELVSWEELF